MTITASIVSFFLDIIHAMNSPCASVLTWRMKTRSKVIFLKYSQSILNTNQGCNRCSHNVNSSLILTVTIQITRLSSVLFSLIAVVSVSFMCNMHSVCFLCFCTWASNDFGHDFLPSCYAYFMQLIHLRNTHTELVILMNFLSALNPVYLPCVTSVISHMQLKFFFRIICMII